MTVWPCSAECLIAAMVLIHKYITSVVTIIIPVAADAKHVANIMKRDSGFSCQFEWFG